MILVSFIGVCTFEEKGISFHFYSLALAGKAFDQSSHTDIMGGLTVVSVGRLAARVLGWADMVSGSASGQAWCLSPWGLVGFWVHWGRPGARVCSGRLGTFVCVSRPAS